MHADTLEQIVDDYLQLQGYFTTHNVRFRPNSAHPDYDASEDGGASDIDVIGYHPKPPPGTDSVQVVQCKAWQSGFNPTTELAILRRGGSSHGKEAWKSFRELWSPKWGEAFRSTIVGLTGVAGFSYRIAVTRLRGQSTARTWEQEPRIKENLAGSSFDFLTLEEMWATMLARLTTTPASSEIGRLAQLLKAGGLTASTVVVRPSPPVPGSDAAIAEDKENAMEL